MEKQTNKLSTYVVSMLLIGSTFSKELISVFTKNEHTRTPIYKTEVGILPPNNTPIHKKINLLTDTIPL